MGFTNQTNSDSKKIALRLLGAYNQPKAARRRPILSRNPAVVVRAHSFQEGCTGS